VVVEHCECAEFVSAMKLIQVIIDGFKSYAKRTEINDWDKSFNAITGLNGSGKSNILDSICFVLGISNLSQVRAKNLNDLIYKQGNTDVKQATVTLVFDNSDPSQTPNGACVCVCMCAYVYSFLRVCLHIVYALVYTHIHIHIHMYTHTYTYTCTYTCTYTYTVPCQA
jgi:hypothetical protein